MVKLLTGKQRKELARLNGEKRPRECDPSKYSRYQPDTDPYRKYPQNKGSKYGNHSWLLKNFHYHSAGVAMCLS